MADLENVDILQGSAPTSGGIVVRKKKTTHLEPEGPKVSLLGLDKLAGKTFTQIHYSFTVKSFLNL